MEIEKILAAIQIAADTIATPNWAAWLSAVAALGAVAVAIVVAIKQNKIAKKQNEIAEKQAEIAEQQNKIALFHERYAMYCELQRIIILGKQLRYRGMDNRSVVLHQVEDIYGIDLKIGETVRLETTIRLLSKTQVTRSEFRRAIFLFPGIKERDIVDLATAWTNYLIMLLEEGSSLEDTQKIFHEKCDAFLTNYLEMMESQLVLN